MARAEPIGVDAEPPFDDKGRVFNEARLLDMTRRHLVPALLRKYP